MPDVRSEAIGDVDSRRSALFIEPYRLGDPCDRTCESLTVLSSWIRAGVEGTERGKWPAQPARHIHPIPGTSGGAEQRGPRSPEDRDRQPELARSTHVTAEDWRACDLGRVADAVGDLLQPRAPFFGNRERRQKPEGFRAPRRAGTQRSSPWAVTDLHRSQPVGSEVHVLDRRVGAYHKRAVAQCRNDCGIITNPPGARAPALEYPANRIELGS